MYYWRVWKWGNAKNITIHNDEDGADWDVESWMDTLSDDADVVETLWQILGAIIRPNVAWNKSAWFYAESGNNGMGTLCELMRQLCGEGSYESIKLEDRGKESLLEPLIGASKKFAEFCEFYKDRMSAEEITAVAQGENKLDEVLDNAGKATVKSLD